MYETRIEIAARFVAAHRINNIDEWLPANTFDSNKKLDSIYCNLINDQYGCVQNDGETDDEGNQIVFLTKFWVEIHLHDSVTKQAILFSWILPTENY